MNQPLIILGAGGHARVVATVARRCGWQVVAILDRVGAAKPEEIDGILVSGPYAEASRHRAAGVRHAALAIGDNDERAALFSQLSQEGFLFPGLQHPSAIVEDNARIGEGTLICAGAIIGAMARVGRNVIVNTGAIVDHECEIGDHAHLAPGCRLAGRVRVGEGTMVGIGTTVREKIRIGSRSTVGAGSVVVADIPDRVVAFGCPARVMRTLAE